jgi:hypothetical protein
LFKDGLILRVYQMKKEIILIGLLVLLCLPGLFHYSLWDDEANTALTGKAILRSGTTSAQVDDRNFLLYRHGSELQKLINNYLPPLPAYVVAISFQCFGTSGWSARIPFLAFGLAGLVCLFLALGRAWPETSLVTIYIILMTGNVSLALFLANCRYYALAFGSTLGLVLIYILPFKPWAKVSLLSFCGTVLAGSNYLNYAALLAVLVVQQMLRNEPRLKLNKGQWATLLISQGFVLLFLGIYYNPLSRQVVIPEEGSRLTEKLILMWWNVRDFDSAQFGSLPILVSAGVWSYFCHQRQIRSFLRQGLFVMAIYIFGITILSPQPVSQTSFADIRYLVPLIPLALFVEALFLASLLIGKNKTLLVLAVLVSGTNLFQLQFFRTMEFRSFFLDRIGEIIRPPAEPYSETSSWISSHVAPGKSVWVVPDFMTYPLMFHAPQAVYAWQLRPEQKDEEQFKNLPDIHFQGLVPPDYIVAFGPSVVQIRQLVSQWSLQGMNYQEVTRLLIFWKDLYRPELFWRTFKPIENFDPNTEAIYIFKKQP